ncbi:MAG: hypothetical protein ABEI99_07660, partial [Halobaculum sp.]
MSSDSSISERRIGNAAGKAAADRIGDKIGRRFEELKSEIEETNRSLDQLQRRVEGLEQTITEIERKKARAERRATEDLKQTLEEEYEEKRDEYQRRLGEVLDDYRESIKRLKDRFLNSISDSSQQFEQVESEFERVVEHRSKAASGAAEFETPHAANYEDRRAAVTDARDDFLGTIDDFLADREDTAAKIDSMQTSIPGVTGATRVQIPFWVVGVRRDGDEELRVYPVQNRGHATEPATRTDPYRPYLRNHSTHQYSDMTRAVQQHVQRDAVRDALAREEQTFADADFLRRNDAVADRFVDALVEHELADRGGTSGGGSETSGGR